MATPTQRCEQGHEWPQIRGYRILGVLGIGGMGVVYKAEQESLKRTVALKMLQAGDRASPEDLKRFRTEAEAIAKLAHPNIVTIYEVNEHEGRPFLVMEFLDGGNLADTIRAQTLPPRAAADLLATLARAVHFAHEKRIIHRDLKPSNVLLRRGHGQSVPKISDFGLAKLLDANEQLTYTGNILGTPSYLSPEQASGRARDADARADVYSLGAILYELLTGRPPFRGGTREQICERVIREYPPEPRKLNPEVPQDLETICLKCLEKKPRRRYPSAAALAADLDLFLKEQPIPTRPVGALTRIARQAGQNPSARRLALILSLLLAVAVLGLLGVAGARFLFPRKPGPPDGRLTLPLSGGWEATLTWDIGTAIREGDRVVGKLATAVLRHPEFGEFESVGPSVDLANAQTPAEAVGSIEGEFRSKKLHEKWTQKTPSGSVWMKGKIVCAKEQLHLEPSALKLELKGDELHAYVRGAIRDIPLGEHDFGGGLRATGLLLAARDLQFKYAGNAIDVVGSTITLTGKLQRKPPAFSVPFEVRGKLKGQCRFDLDKKAAEFVKQELILTLDPQSLEDVQLKVGGDKADAVLLPALDGWTTQDWRKQVLKALARSKRLQPFAEADPGLRALLQRVVLTRLAITPDVPEQGWITVQADCLKP